MPENLEVAQQLFELALQKDPNYALAYVGLAETWGARGHMGLVPPQEAFPKTKEAAFKALELDDTIGQAHATLANIRFYLEWDWSAAEREYRRAIELNPNYPEAPRTYSLFLASMGRREKAMAESQRCLELDPHNSLFQYNFGLRFLDLGRYDDAIAQFQKGLRTEGSLPAAHRGLWDTFRKQRMYEEALAQAKKLYAALGDGEVAEALARGYAEGGYARAMRIAAEKLAARSKLTDVQPTKIAHLYAYSGEKDRALDWLEMAYQDRDSQLVYLNWHLAWDSLRDEPRFRDLLRRMNLPEREQR